MDSRIRTLIGAVAVAGLVGAAATVHATRERRFPPPAAQEDSLYVTSGTTVKRLTAGYGALAADLYWIRAIQYYGGVKLRLEQEGQFSPAAAAPAAGQPRSDYTLLHPLLDLTTTLDPQFNIAYRFGSIFLAEPYPGGAGRPDLAIALLKRDWPLDPINGSTCRTSGSCTTGGGTTTRPPRSGSRRPARRPAHPGSSGRWRRTR